MKKKNVTLNFLYQLAYQILTIILPLITAPFLSRRLGSESMGIYSYTYVVVSYFVMFAALGIDTYGNRAIAFAKEKGQDELNYTFSSLYYMHIIVAFTALVLYLVYGVFFSKDYRLITLLQIFFVIGTLFDVNWFFFGIEEFKITVTRNLLIKILTVLAVFLFVRSSQDLWKYTIIMSIGSFVSQSVVWVFIPKYTRLVKVKAQDIFAHLRPLLIMFVAVIATSLYRMIDKLMLGWTGNMSVLGQYEYADRIMRMATTIITALGTVMLPRMSSLYASGAGEKAQKYILLSSKFVFIISFALAFGLGAISKEFMIAFLGDGYEMSGQLLLVLVASIPFMGWNNLVRTQILMPKMKDRIYTRAVWVGAIVNVILNGVLIFTVGAKGAAFATVISYAVVGAFQTYPIRKEYPLKEYFKSISGPLVSGIIMFWVVRWVGNKMGISLLAVFVEICVGAGCYLFLNALFMYFTDRAFMQTIVKKMVQRGKFVDSNKGSNQ